MAYTLAEAAKAAGRSKPAILAAIQKGRISARKNAFGQWEIDPAELHRVYEPFSGNETQTTELSLAVKLNEVLQRQVEDLKQERDDWKREAYEWRLQAKALPPGQVDLAELKPELINKPSLAEESTSETEPPKKLSWWKIIFGGGK